MDNILIFIPLDFSINLLNSNKIQWQLFVYYTGFIFIIYSYETATVRYENIAGKCMRHSNIHI